jgi:hypothetical protein
MGVFNVQRCKRKGSRKLNLERSEKVLRIIICIIITKNLYVSIVFIITIIYYSIRIYLHQYNLFM